MIKQYRKKPIVIEAIQYTGDWDNLSEVIGWMFPDMSKYHNWTLDDERYPIQTLEGVMYASPNDWIIKGVNGEFYPCKPDIFEKSYEEVLDQTH